MNHVIRLASSISLVLLAAGCVNAQDPTELPLNPKKVIPEKPPADPLLAKLTKADPNDDALRLLLKARYKAAAEVIRQLEPRLGTIPHEDYLAQIGHYQSGLKRLLDAGSELTDKPEEKIALLKRHVEIATAFEKKMKDSAAATLGAPHLLGEAIYFRLDAEIKLMKAEKAFEKAGKK